MKEKTRQMLLVGIFLVSVASQGCRNINAASNAASKISTPSTDAVQPIGCHAVDASSNRSAPNQTSDPCPHSNAVETGDMVFIKGGRFLMGTNGGTAAEGPAHPVMVNSFWMDRKEVTVAQFAAFVQATGYRTEAEGSGWAGVFAIESGEWKKVNGGEWRHPEGPSSVAPSNEPVTQVSWNDAAEYARWCHKRLPTEAEFEYAARGGLSGKKYSWGDDLVPHGRYRANCWQGSFPDRNLGNDGFIRRAPVGSFPPNGYGLYDITGNVWEWCSDWFDEAYYRASPLENPGGPSSGETRVIRGGSWLCSENYCVGYRVAARNQSAPDSGLNNLGFRCVTDQ